MTPPLVSVIVLAYNSEPFVIETLESIKEQDYPHIELIVTDDCSKDDTYNTCQKWIKANSTKFCNTILTHTPINSGVSANCNHGLSFANGKYIKFIAGDDLLLPKCITTNIGICEDSQFKGLLFSGMKYIGDANPDTFQRFEQAYDTTFLSKIFSLPYPQFYRKLLIQDFLPAPTAFISKEVFDIVGKFDESMPLIEDYPFYLRAAERRLPFRYIGDKTIAYRLHDRQLSRSNTFNTSPSYTRVESLRENMAFSESKLLWLDCKLRKYGEKHHAIKFLINGIRALNPCKYTSYYKLKPQNNPQA